MTKKLNTLLKLSAVFTVMLCSVCLFACSNHKSPESGGTSANSGPDTDTADSNNALPDDLQEENPFDTQNENNAGVPASIYHNAAATDSEMTGKLRSFQYEGGELQIPYQVSASGKGKNIGFLVYIDGIAQPYRIESDISAETDPSSYQYMHVLALEEDDKEYSFQLCFTPVTGKKGDTLSLTVSSLFAPDYMPDMKTTGSYGNYHGTLPAVYEISFLESPDISDTAQASSLACLKNVIQSEEPVTQDYLDTLTGLAGSVTLESLNKQIFTEQQLNGQGGYIDNYSIDSAGTLHLTYKITGYPGARYQNTIYINHQALSDDSQRISFETVLTKGTTAILEAEIDLSQLKEMNTLYVVSCLSNVSELWEDGTFYSKSPSVLLYKNGRENADETAQAVPTAAKAVSFSAAKKIDWSKVSGKIKKLYAAGKNKVVILTDQMTLYDISTGKTWKSSKKAENLLYFQTLENGYAALFQTDSGTGSPTIGLSSSKPTLTSYAVFYDSKLKQGSVIDLTKKVKQWDDFQSPETFSISTDGSKFAFASSAGLYLYNVKSGKCTALMDLTSGDTNRYAGIVAIEQTGFTNNGKTVACKTQSFDIPPVPGKESFDTIAWINTDSTNLINKKINNYPAKALASYSDKLLVQEDFRTADGRIMVISGINGLRKTYDLTDSKEGGSVYASAGGKYFATAVSGKTGWIIRVYDMKNGKLLAQEAVSNGGEKLYAAQDPIVQILDDSRTCIVLLGARHDNIRTKTASFSF